MPICGGVGFVVYLSGSGEVATGGSGQYGQLGHGDQETQAIPRVLETLPRITEIATGWHHTLCLGDDGTLYAFGRSSEGQLGLPPLSEGYPSPHIVPELPPIRTIACGYYHSMCVGHDDSLWAMGSNIQGQLGVRREENPFRPHLVSNMAIQKVACGHNFTLLLGVDGILYGAGANNSGQIGMGATHSVESFQKVPLDASVSITQMACGDSFSLLLDSHGTVWSSGDNARGQLGLGPTHQKLWNYQKIPQLTAESIHANYACAFVITPEQNLVGWGYGYCSFISRDVYFPQPLWDDIEAVALSIGGFFVLSRDGTSYVCGQNGHGQLWTEDCRSLIQFTPSSNITTDLFATKVTGSRAKSARSQI